MTRSLCNLVEKHVQISKFIFKCTLHLAKLSTLGLMFVYKSGYARKRWRVDIVLVSISVGQYYSPYILSYGPVALGGTNKTWTLYECMDCGNKYKHKGSLQRHIKYECRKQPSFKCPYCVYRAYQKHNLLLHERHLHKDLPERVDFVTGDQDDDANDVVLKCRYRTLF